MGRRSQALVPWPNNAVSTCILLRSGLWYYNCLDKSASKGGNVHLALFRVVHVRQGVQAASCVEQP